MQVRDSMIRMVLALISVLVTAFAVTAAEARTGVTGVRLGSHPDGITRFVMDLSDGMDFTVAAQADPDRIIVATPDLAWNTAPARPFGSVLGLRYQNGGAGGRIVLDLKDPATVKSAFVMSPRDGQGWRFVMDLQQTTRAAFLATVAKPKATPLAKAAIPAPVAPAAVSAVAASPAAAPAAAPATSAPQRIVLYSPEVTPPPPAPLVKAPMPVRVEPVAETGAAAVVAKAEPIPVPVAKPKVIQAGSPMMSAPVPPPLERPQAPAAPAALSAAAAPAALSAVPAPAALSAVPVMPAIAAAPPGLVAPEPAVTPPMPPPMSPMVTPMVTKVSASLLADPDPRGLPADGRPVIVIDPGHGGVDPGAIGVSGIYEKNITLAVAREVKAALEKGNRYKVHLTRDRDIFIRLRERVALGRQFGADLFISLHADSVANPQLKGLSVYTLSQNASDSEAQALADKENKADLIAGIDLSHESADVTNILIDLAQRETMNRSAVFAGGIVDEVGRETPLLGNTHRFAGFAVLKAPDVPSVLIELGYLSNETEERNLRQPEYRARLAKAVARSIDRFFLQGQKARRP